MKYPILQHPVSFIGKYIALCIIVFFFGFSQMSVKVRAQSHLLLSEVVLQPSQAEYIEIYNPTTSPVSLDNYYLADNQVYPYVPGGGISVDVGDFIVRFPAGTTIDSNQTIVVAASSTAFETYYGLKSDFEIYAGDATVPDMIIIDDKTAVLSNQGEGIALFYWDGIASIVKTW